MMPVSADRFIKGPKREPDDTPEMYPASAGLEPAHTAPEAVPVN